MINKLKWISAPKEINSPMFRKEFELEEVTEDSSVTICGLGYFELYINGVKVSDYFVPNQTDYDEVTYSGLQYDFKGITKKTVKYLTYDVSKYLKSGKNTVVVWLGNGWYIQNTRITEGVFDYGGILKFMFSLKCGDVCIESDESWQWLQSPITFDNLFVGEIFDARLYDAAFFGNGYISEQYAAVTAPPKAEMSLQVSPSDKVRETFEAVPIGNGIYDLGKNIAGFVKIKCNGSKGAKVDLYYAEDLGDDGELDYTSTTGYVEGDINQIQHDMYYLSGDADEEYQPRFVWHGFRYVKIEADADVKIEAVTGYFVCTELKERASFECSNEVINAIHNIYLTAQLANIHGCVPSDCPHRERLGYTGDGQFSSISAMTNFDAHDMYIKWLEDIKNAQNTETGYATHTAPYRGGGGGHAWGSAIAVIPWNIYNQYGDTETARAALPNIAHWIEYMKTCFGDEGLICRETEGSWCLGDWIVPGYGEWDVPHDIKIQSDFVNTVWFIIVIDIYSRISGDYDKYNTERKNAVDAINRKYLDDIYDATDEGTAYYALFADIVPEDKKEAVTESIKRTIEDKEFKFHTGIVGTALLFNVLDKCGLNEYALKMLMGSEYPSYGYMCKMGATSLWETWEGTGSKSHTGLGAYDAWLFYGLCGIKPDGGYKNVTICPLITDLLDSYSGSIEGISVKYNKINSTLEIQIPEGTEALLKLPHDEKTLGCGNYTFNI